MNTTRFLIPSLATLSLATLALTATADGTPITPLAAYAQSNYAANRSAKQAIDGSGMSENGTTHGNNNTTMWMGKDKGTGFAKWFVVDLGAVYTLDSVKFWNFNMPSYTQRGLKQVDIFVSATDAAFSGTPDFTDAATWTLAVENHVIAQANGSTAYAGDTPLSLNLAQARWVGLRIDSVWSTSGDFGYGGLSEIRFYEASVSCAVSAAEFISVTSDSATFSAQLLSTTASSLPVRLVYAPAEAGDDPAEWTLATEYSTLGTGMIQLSVSGLSQDTVYKAAFCADAGEDGLFYSEPVPFAISTVTVGVPEDFYENDPRLRALTFTRSIAVDAPLTVNYTVEGTAVAGTDYAALSGSVVISNGETSVSVPFTALDNDAADGSRTALVSVAAGCYLAGAPASFTILDDESASASECVWTGGGDGVSWEDPANWSGAAVPRLVDDAVFVSGASPALGTAQAVRTLVLRTTGAVSLVSAEDATPSLAIGGLLREDVEGTEANTVLGVPLKLYALDGTNCVWDLNGSGKVQVNADLGLYGGSVCLKKTGLATLEMNYNGCTFGGTWNIYEGTVSCAKDDSFQAKTAVSIGGGENAATLAQNAKTRIRGSVEVTVLTNGYFNCGDINNGRLLSIHAKEGGVARGGYIYACHAYFTGGRIYGGGYWNGGWVSGEQDIRSYASDTMARMESVFTHSGSYNLTIAVEDGGAPVDLLFSGGMREGANGKTMNKTGAGVCKVTTGLDNKSKFAIKAGTWLADNETGSGTGTYTTSVAGGATLGGLGHIGGANTSQTFSLAGSSGSPAVLAPGSIDEVTGDHVYGTLTAGSESATNTVTFGAYSTLRVGFAVPDRHDSLMVYGAMALSGSNKTLEVVLPESLEKMRAGEYVVATATEGITGTFETVSVSNPSAKVSVTENEIIVSIPYAGTLLLVK